MTNRAGAIPIFIIRSFSFLWLVTMAAAAGATDSPQVWLERMSVASSMYNYRGTLVHMCGGKVDIVKIVHRVENGEVTERITAQDVSGREIIRNANEVMCILPDEKTVMVDQRGSPGSVPAAEFTHMPSFASVDRDIYQLEMLPAARIAGQDTIVISVTAADEYRYGYRLWLDNSRALPLKFELVSEQNETLEQTVFTEILFDDQLLASDVAPTTGMNDFIWQRAEPSVKLGVSDDLPDAAGVATHSSNGWECGAMPDGFKLTMARSQIAENAGATMEHLVYSDGLASVSIFIEGGVAAVGQQTGMSQLGATNAYTTVVDGYLVTAVGGVPLGTAKMMAMSVQPMSDLP
jgi:sigma-E factor negative regulatory protein RseB